jgi:hypothetical protein
MIQPTVGRKVYFWPQGNDRSLYNIIDATQPLDATILFVHGNECINILVIDHMGHPHFVDKANLVQPEMSPVPGFSHVAWMPYQVGQAQPKDQEQQQA